MQQKHFQTKDAFIAHHRAILDHSTSVEIDDKALQIFADYLKKNASDKPVRWEKYISEAANQEPLDLQRVVFEFILISAQNGGYLYSDETGATKKWELGGSGADALVAKMKEIREAKALPGLDIPPEEVEARIGPLLQNIPYAEERLAIFKELAAQQVQERIKRIIDDSHQDDGGYHFDYNTMLALAELSPQGLGEDPYLKKAALAVLLLANHLEARGVQVTTDVPAAAEYRLLQTLEAAGVINIKDDALATQINQNILLDENDPQVQEMRSAIVVAVKKLSDLTELPDRVLDSTLWFVGRKPQALKDLRQAIEEPYAQKYQQPLGGGNLKVHFAAIGMRFRTDPFQTQGIFGEENPQSFQARIPVGKRFLKLPTHAEMAADTRGYLPVVHNRVGQALADMDGGSLWADREEPRKKAPQRA